MVIEDKKLDELIKNKTSDNYNLLDLQTITKLKINFIFEYKEILKLSNLEELIFTSIEIKKELLLILNKLSKLKKIVFINCFIERLDYLDNIYENLHIENSTIDSVILLNKYTKLKAIALVGFEELDLEKIQVINNIENINLMNSKIINEDRLIYLNKVKDLCLINTEINNIDTLIENESLERLVIDDEIYNKNKKVIKYLLDKNVNIVDIDGESYGDIDD